MRAKREKCTHVSAQHATCLAELNDQPPVRTQQPWRNDLGALPEVRWTDVSGPPASRSYTRRRSYTQGVDEQPSIEVKQLQPGSLLKDGRS